MHGQQSRQARLLATPQLTQQPSEAHMQRPEALRRLMQATEDPYSNITIVTTALELQDAVQRGAGYIELRDHVDLSTIDAVEIPSATPNLNPEPSYVLLGEVPKAVLSIRGNCTNPPTAAQLRAMRLDNLGTGAPLLPFLPGQCLMVGDRKFLDTFRGSEEGDTSAVTGEWHRLWLDNLYLRYKKTTSAPEGYGGGLLSLTSSSEVWMTYMTLQGDGRGRMECGACGVRAGGTSLYAEGCTFADFEGDMVLHTNTRATTALLACRFLHNVGTPLGVVNAKSAADGSGALVRIDRCTFTNNTGPHLLQMMRWVPEARPAFYTDSRMHVFRNGTQISKPTDTGKVSIVDTEGEASQPLLEYPDRYTLSANSEWFEQLQQDESGLGAAPHTSVLEEPDLLPSGVPSTTVLENNTAYDAFIAPLYPSSGISQRRAAVIGGSAAAAVILALLAAVLVLRILRRRRSQRDRDAAANSIHKDAVESNTVPEESVAPPPGPPNPGNTFADTTEATKTTVDVTTDTNSPIVPPASTISDHANLNLNSNYRRSSSLLLSSDATHVTHSTTRASLSSTFTHSNTTTNSTSMTNATTHTVNDDPSAMHAMTSDFAYEDPHSQAPNATNLISTHEVPSDHGVTTGALGMLGVPKPPRSTPPGTETVLVEDAQEVVATGGEGTVRVPYATSAFSMGVALPRTSEGTVDSGAARMHGGPGSTLFPTAHVHASYDVAHTHAQSMAAWRTMAAHYGTQATFDASTDKVSSPRMSVLPPVAAGGILDRENLERALDEMSASGELFLGQFELLGARNRRQGGQGVVQFARSTARSEQSTESVAIKFFLNRNAFVCEEALYKRGELRGMMPAISMLENNELGVAVTAQGGRFPPFIVVERGESLDEWQRRIQPDFATIVQVLSHVTDRVKTLHALGVAHRDLKPGNVLWRPLEHSWTLIDFGCAAEIGVTTRLTFTPAYAPPETLQALADGGRTTEATAAADVWVIGVIAFELATKHAAFPRNEWKYDDIISAARGEIPYPWEEKPGTFRNAPELRILAGVVRECLCRTPPERPSAAAVLGKLNSLFDSGS